jgi:antitoxin VapB
VAKPLNVKDPEAYRLANALAHRTGQSLTQVVVKALREAVERNEKRRRDPARMESIREIQERVAALPELDTRSVHEILGYNDRGTFA